MGLRSDLVGTSAGPFRVSWSAPDALLYAVAVGAGQADPLAELQWTTDNSSDIAQQVLPTFAIGLMHYRGPEIDLGPVDPSQRLHAELALSVSGALPVAGEVDVRSEITGVFDKGSGALVVFESTATDPGTGQWIARTTSGSFIRGAGGFGGDRGPASGSGVPDQPPTRSLGCSTRPDQALLFRLCGDFNPLHSDPAVATRGGFSRPILHGLCSYGVVGRVLVNELCGGAAARMRGMYTRFTKPVLPGESLTVEVWDTGAAPAAFRVRDESGDTVLDRGIFSYE